MLVMLYITSVVSCIFAIIYEKCEKYKNCRTAFAISIISGVLYVVPTTIAVFTNLFNPNFKTVFGLTSLIFWHIGIWSDDIEHCVDYIFSALIGSAILCFIFSNIYYTDYLQPCNENHDYTERIYLVTTVDGTESGESIFGEGFTVGLIYKDAPNTHLYKYYYQTEDGDIVSAQIYGRRTQIIYIEPGEEPYLEVSHSVRCSGYRRKTETHVYRDTHSTYTLYIPRNSVASISSSN